MFVFILSPAKFLCIVVTRVFNVTIWYVYSSFNCIYISIYKKQTVGDMIYIYVLVYIKNKRSETWYIYIYTYIHITILLIKKCLLDFDALLRVWTNIVTVTKSFRHSLKAESRYGRFDKNFVSKVPISFALIPNLSGCDA